MFGLRLDTFDRDEAAKNPAARPFIETYLRMRVAIGTLGVLLPVILVVVDRFFVNTDAPVRSSMSAYYHSSARDVFVGGLIATGIFLITYMSAKRRTYDFVLSTTAGCLLIVVALFPTARDWHEFGERFAPSRTSCTTHAGPPLCDGLQLKFGEDVVRTIHQYSAGAFVVLLAALCVVFALREFGYGPEAKALVGADRNVRAVLAELKARHANVLVYLVKGLPTGAPCVTGEQPRPPRRRVLSYLASGVVIVLSSVWAVTGVGITVPFVAGKVGPTYLGEFVAFVSFGVAWLTAALDLMPRPVQAATDTLAGAVDSVTGAAPGSRD